MNAENSFDKLAIGISPSERIALLKKLEDSLNPEEQSIEEPLTKDNATIDLKTKLKTESFLLRFWLKLKSLFSTFDMQYLYNEHIIKARAKNIERNIPDILNYKKGYLLTTFFHRLRELKTVAEYFKPGVALYEEDPGRFYVFLGSILVPDVAIRMEKEVSPYTIPFDQELTPDMRTSLIRKMDEVLQEIPQADRGRIYIAVRSIEWLRQFVRMPFEKCLSKFISLVPNEFSCSIDTVANDLAQFSRVLSNGKRVETEVLEAMYVFIAQKQITEEQIDVDEKTTEFVKKSLEQVAIIRRFINEIPIRQLASIAYRRSEWSPSSPEGAEDWFVKYKNYWRKLFDNKWESWLRDKKKLQTQQVISEFLGVSGFPTMKNQPWKDSWEDLKLPHDLSFAFLTSYYERIFPKYNNVLKTLLMEGDFIQKDNRIEFTDAVNELNHQRQCVESLNNRLAPEGEIGQAFEKIISECFKSIQGKSRIDSLMLSIDSEVSIILKQFRVATESIHLVLNGILSDNRDSKYASLANLASIQGKDNAKFRQDLLNIQRAMLSIIDMLRDLESIELFM